MNPLPNPMPPAKLAWAYIRQLGLVWALYGIGVWLWGVPVLTEFIIKSGKDWAQLEGVILAAALVVWGMYVNFTTSGFGDYLRWSRREFSYRIAFTTALFSPLLAAILLIIASNTYPSMVQHAALLALINSIFEVYGTYRNIVSLSEKKRLFEELLATHVVDDPNSNSSSNKYHQPHP